ncbi:MAG: hypothetical protein J7J98_06855 [candidate division Zixibacteria bacterium]|nr:hypothetical protein [candidate division Zixibacteria bacterium]
MATTVDIERNTVLPSAEQVLAGQAIPADRLSDRRTADLAEAARATFERLAQPIGLLADTTIEEFGIIYSGDGMNNAETVLDEIYPISRYLFLFAITVGEPICKEISALFERNDFAAAAMLDAAASAGAELAVEAITRRYENELLSDGRLNSSQAVLPFSPGYCGWHISGQKKLFGRLKPETIGITLSGSCLMQPLKSVSGVLVAAAISDFDVDDTYSFCAECSNHSCQDRYHQLKEIRKTT